MPKKKKYFPNNWSEYKNAPDDMFLDHTFQELLNWKVLGWELPSSVSTMIRETHILTKKVWSPPPSLNSALCTPLSRQEIYG